MLILITFTFAAMKILSILALFVVLPLALFAQDENWDAYMAQYEGKPGSVLLNMGLKTSAPLKEYPFVLVTGVRFSGCSSEGMPTAKEFESLYKISDSVLAVIKQIGKYKLVGTFTHQCERLDYYYTADTIGLREKLSEYYKQLSPLYKPFINIKSDVQWSAYLDILYPKEEVYEFMQNQKVVMQLEKGGDKLDQARQADHWLNFTTEKDRNCFISYAINHDYKIESKRNDGKLSAPFQLQISRIDKVDISSISKLTLLLRKEARKCNGDYDGWETFVVR